ncbi:MAG: glycosyltransferase family 2 protein [Candidatus Poribacteria bacterium]
MISRSYTGKISVIIPCYNQGKFLADAVRSVEMQTYHTYEIIVVDDGSTDQYTIDCIDALAAAGRVILLRDSNEGLSVARNRGFTRSIGDFVQFLDSDDLLHPQKFEKQIDHFYKISDLDVSIVDFQLTDATMTHFYKSSGTDIVLFNDTLRDFLFRWERSLCIPIHCALFRRQIWGDQSPFLVDFQAKEDWLMWIDLARKGVKIGTIPENLAYYRQHGSNMCLDTVAMAGHYVTAAFRIAQELDPQLRREFIAHVSGHLGDAYFDKQKRDLVAQFESGQNYGIRWFLFKIAGRIRRMFKRVAFFPSWFFCV